MNILALDTSTEACSVAVRLNSGEVFSEFELTPRQHTAYLPVMLESVLKQAELPRAAINVIAYTNGPGAFTGVRIAAAMAQGMAIGLCLPLLPVSTLAVLAQQAWAQLQARQIVAALDARMGEVYVGWYRVVPDSGLVESQAAEALIKADQLVLSPGSYGVGSGFCARREAGIVDDEGAVIDPSLYPTAEALLDLAAAAVQAGQLCAIDQAGINYIRNQVAEKSKPR